MGKKNNKNKKAAANNQQPATEPAVAEPAAVAAATTAAAAATPEVVDTTEPIATPSDVPGGFPVTPSNELEEKTVSVNPLPATAGTGNPIKLAPGEKIPESITAQDVNKHVKLDKASYEKSDALPTAPALSTEVPAVSGTMIPESSLPMGDKTDVADVTINSVGPASTTAVLAGQVPLEPKVPEVVKESQEKAGVAPEASAVPEEVKEKAKVEEEIKSKVPEAPATSVGTAGDGTEKKENTGTILGAAAATGGAAVAAAVAAVSKFSEDAAPTVNNAKTATAETISNSLPETVKSSLPIAAQEALGTEKKETPVEKISPEVPKEVKESIVEAGKSPEAAVSTAAVHDKKAVETELLKEVKEAPAVGDATESSTATETKAATTTPVVVKPAEEEPVAVKPLDDKPVDVKPAETQPAAAATTTTSATTTTPAATTAATSTTAAANGTETKPTEPSSSTAVVNGNGTESKPAGSTTGEKKKNRLSIMFDKLKAKLK